MADYGATDRVRQSAAQTFIEPARQRGDTIVKINSGHLARLLVEKRELAPNRFALVCNALRSTKFLKQNKIDLIRAEGPASGLSSTIEFTYRIAPQSTPGEKAKSKEEVSEAMAMFLKLRGISKDFYKEVGGAEAYHTKFRDDWDR